MTEVTEDARLVDDYSQPAVRLERDLPDPPAVVWGALTEPERLREWFPCEIVVAGDEWKVDAGLSFPFPAEVIEMTLSGEVLEVEEPRRLSFTWGEEVLHFKLTPHEAGLETGRGDWKPRFERYSVAFEPALGPQEGPPAGYKGENAE
jgi:uncharacterized protein YndB with AHSA1/START domain